MSILDDAIREHLELKRAHGADESELKRLEDEAFGPPGRPEEPDPFAEAPTEFMAQPGAGAAADEAEGSGRSINVADLQEPPPPEPQDEAVEAPTAPEEAEEPAVAEPAEEAPSEPAAGPSTAEREAIAEQPTEFFDIEADLKPEGAPAEAASPSDEELFEEEVAEPRLAPGGRLEAVPQEDLEDEEDDDFWSEQRLSDELDQALEAPVADEHALPPQPPAAGEHTEEHDQLEPDYDPDTGQEDVLEGTPEFLEDAPEDDDLWFEQRPPKDFDFDD
jgi:hypothetical protein